MSSAHYIAWKEEWLSHAQKHIAAYGGLLELTAPEDARLLFIHQHSSYLSQLLIKHPDIWLQLRHDGVAVCWQGIERLLNTPHHAFTQMDALMKHLRYIKQRAALLIALADIEDIWQLDAVTQALSTLAEKSLQRSLEFLLTQASNKQEITLSDPGDPASGSGLMVMAMGKLGAGELNYSSDIDLIIFFERGKLHYQGRYNEQYFLNKLAQDLVTIMQERTADGYVFRTDLRLRPDPSSTPLAVSVDAALQYYESLGQNWERAAMIKARLVAGDAQAGARMLKSLSPYIWRKNLDFASIQDILSIKRQISKKVGIQEELAGHNIKLGKGGIREIEFFVQLHQLIWGGRQKELRSRETLATLDMLCELNHIERPNAELLKHAYVFYRKLEHRLQMVADQQTHELPLQDAGFEHIAAFMGYAHVDEFINQLHEYIDKVHGIFAESFDSEGLHAEGNLVFTGISHDPETLETLRNMGFNNPQMVSQTIMDWHRGSRRCTRSKVARQLLTELVPDILRALSSTVHPDEAFNKFDAFLLQLPVGIQLFSLISNNPHVLQLIADVMGTAPTLSNTLSRMPQLIETALFSGFYEHLPNKSVLLDEIREELAAVDYYDAAMELLRIFKNEKHFQAGIQLLRNFANAEAVGQYLSDLADVLIDSALKLTLDEFMRQYGALPGGRFCIIALGKLGSQELTFGSDVDLMFVYDVQSDAEPEDDNLSHAPSVYYNRLCQRMVNALSAIGANGALYEVDTRLRPSGKQGLLAVSKTSLTQYFQLDAWTFERMALCRARGVAGDVTLQYEVEKQVQTILSEQRDTEQLRLDVVDMRQRVEDEFGSKQMWDLKHVAGGLMDIDFVAQYMILAVSHRFPQLTLRRSRDVINTAILHPQITDVLNITKVDLEVLLHTFQFLLPLQHMLRLTSEETTVLENPPAGLAQVLTTHMQQENYEQLKESLKAIEVSCRQAYIRIMKLA